MPNVDFTLQDVKTLLDDRIVAERVYTQGMINTSIAAAISGSESRLTTTLIQYMDRRFDEANTATVELINTVLDQIDHLEVRVSGVEVQLTHLNDQLKITNRVVRRHSADIMELRAAA